ITPILPSARDRHVGLRLSRWCVLSGFVAVPGRFEVVAAGATGLHRPEAAGGGDEAAHPPEPDGRGGVGLAADAGGVQVEEHEVEVAAGAGHDGGGGDAGGVVPAVVPPWPEDSDGSFFSSDFDGGADDFAAGLGGLDRGAVGELVAGEGEAVAGFEVDGLVGGKVGGEGEAEGDEGDADMG